MPFEAAEADGQAVPTDEDTPANGSSAGVTAPNEQPSFSHAPAASSEYDDDYDPDAETVMRVKPIDLSAEEDENHGR